MAEKENCKLFSEFAPNTMQEWIDKVTVDLKGADFNKKLVWRTNEGFNVQPNVWKSTLSPDVKKEVSWMHLRLLWKKEVLHLKKYRGESMSIR